VPAIRPIQLAEVSVTIQIAAGELDISYPEILEPLLTGADHLRSTVVLLTIPDRSVIAFGTVTGMGIVIGANANGPKAVFAVTENT
jgi:hypothetical protein